MVLDGELVAVSDDGDVDFYRLGERVLMLKRPDVPYVPGAGSTGWREVKPRRGEPIRHRDVRRKKFVNASSRRNSRRCGNADRLPYLWCGANDS